MQNHLKAVHTNPPPKKKQKVDNTPLNQQAIQDELNKLTKQKQIQEIEELRGVGVELPPGVTALDYFEYFHTPLGSGTYAAKPIIPHQNRPIATFDNDVQGDIIQGKDVKKYVLFFRAIDKA